ncbi:MAG: 50S ribosomal protein L25 [Verrucomicrobiales bacterium]|nr:50S ribosomal protein L25 [Verrucomicrobiales bacterium]
MKTVALEAFPRTAKKRNAVKRLRAGGRIPAVLYGSGFDTSDVEIDTKAFETLVKNATSEALLLDLACDGKASLALLKEVQYHPLSGEYLHIDLHSVKAGQPVTVFVPIAADGEAVGVKVGGGLLEHVLFRVRLRGLPENIPDVLHVDVSELDVGHTLHVKELNVPEGVEILANDDNPVFSVARPRTVDVGTEDEEGEEGAEGEAADGEEGATGDGGGESKEGE